MVTGWIAKKTAEVVAWKVGTAYVKSKVTKAPKKVGDKLKRKLADVVGVEMPPEELPVKFKDRPRTWLEKLERIGNGTPEPVVPEPIPEPTTKEITEVLAKKAKAQFEHVASKATNPETSKVGRFLKTLEKHGNS